MISTGPYALVRHPMYAGSFLYLRGCRSRSARTGAFWCSSPMMPVLIWRLFDEEKLLAGGLPGYAEYQRAVRWRLIPGIF